MKSKRHGLYLWRSMWRSTEIPSKYNEHSVSPGSWNNNNTPGLFLREGTPGKDGFEIEPLPLDLVQVQNELVQVSQSSLPDLGLVLEGCVIRRIFERLQKTLVVAHLIDQLLKQTLPKLLPSNVEDSKTANTVTRIKEVYPAMKEDFIRINHRQWFRPRMRTAIF